MKSSKVLTINVIENKRSFIFYYLFLVLVIIMASLIVFYISNNIVLVKLGYKILELEKCQAELEGQNRKYEFRADTLSALNRIEAIAYNNLGMIRPKKVEYVAWNRDVNTNGLENSGMVSTNNGKEDYFWASVKIEEKNNLIFGILK